jgi:hypothetical protein
VPVSGADEPSHDTGCQKTPQTCTPGAVSRSGFLGSRI